LVALAGTATNAVKHVEQVANTREAAGRLVPRRVGGANVGVGHHGRVELVVVVDRAEEHRARVHAAGRRDTDEAGAGRANDVLRDATVKRRVDRVLRLEGPQTTGVDHDRLVDVSRSDVLHLVLFDQLHSRAAAAGEAGRVEVGREHIRLGEAARTGAG